MDIWPRFVTEDSPQIPVNLTLTQMQWLWRRTIIPILDYSRSCSNSLVELQVKLNSICWSRKWRGFESHSVQYNFLMFVIWICGSCASTEVGCQDRGGLFAF
jgi:hypothetical protein